MKVLSVDWDYFFQDTDGFDWGHRESPLFIEHIWWHRCSNRHLFTLRDAINMRPVKSRLHKFWDRNIRKLTWPSMMMVSETHAALYQWIRRYPIDELVNYDAHHDLGYPTHDGELECGNWAGKLLADGFLKRYTLVYPPWRTQKRYKETLPDLAKKNVQVHYKPLPPQRYDLVFIARSGAWTPTWCDYHFIRFCEYWKIKAPWLWESKQVVLEPLKERRPNLEEAQQEFVKMRDLYKKMFDQQKGGEKK